MIRELDKVQLLWLVGQSILENGKMDSEMVKAHRSGQMVPDMLEVG